MNRVKICDYVDDITRQRMAVMKHDHTDENGTPSRGRLMDHLVAVAAKRLGVDEKIREYEPPKLTPQQQWIVDFMKGREWTHATDIGIAYGKPKKTAYLWSHRKCFLLVEKGYLKYREKGMFREITRKVKK